MPPRSPLPRSAVVAWVLLDWAASGFSTISITLLVAYVDTVVFADGRWGVPGGVIWAWTLAVAMLSSAMLSPLLAAWADRRRSQQAAVVASSTVGAAACLALALLPPTAPLPIAAAIVVANVAFDMAAIFTGSLLPKLAAGPAADRLSAAGFAAGYAGGAIALLLATAVVASRESLGITAAGGLRVGFAIMGGWWLLFTLPAALVRIGDGPSVEHAPSSLAELCGFVRDLLFPADTRSEPSQLGWLLAGVVTVLGVVQTAISQFSNVALETFHLDPAALVRLVLLVQLVALPGAVAVGWLSGRRGRQWTAGVCLAGWSAVLALAGLIETVQQLYALAVLLALVLGGIQSVLRAMLAVAAPVGHHAATFGLMQVGTKLTGFLASLAFGWAYVASGVPRAGLTILLVQLLVGWWLLARRRSGSELTAGNPDPTKTSFTAGAGDSKLRQKELNPDSRLS